MSGAELAVELKALSDKELMRRASEWIEAACLECYDGGGPMPSEIEGRRMAVELADRARGD